MDRFVSNFVLRLDSKGRASIPAPFRSVLRRDGREGLYRCPTLDRPALDAGGQALLAEIEALVARFHPFSNGFHSFSNERERFATARVLKKQIGGQGAAPKAQGARE